MIIIILLLIASVVGLWLTWTQFRKNMAAIKAKNASEPSAFQRALNYPFSLVWYGYLAALCVGLFVNNVFLR